MNVYGYASNKPIRQFDPFGLSPAVNNQFANPSNGDGGYIYCEGGPTTDEDPGIRIPIEEGACYAIQYCNFMHELVHAQQTHSRSPMLCKKPLNWGKPITETDKGRRLQNEADAHMVECNCLQNFRKTLEACGDQSDCLHDIQQHICQINLGAKPDIESGVYPNGNGRGTVYAPNPRCYSRCLPINPETKGK